VSGIKCQGSRKTPIIVLATAHPAKFKETVEEAIGSKISLPSALAKLRGKTKKSIVIGKNYAELYSQLTTHNSQLITDN